MSLLSLDAPGKEVLLMGNEAMARGAIEAGVRVAAAYPGNPSSEIIGSLAEVAQTLDMYVEWSVNEKVALEVAAAAAASGLNALVAMKQNGLNVAADFLLNLNLTGILGGLVLVVCDDPSGISSTNEQDTRIYAKLADLPLFEPGTFHEAKDMIKEAFQVSRRLGTVCMLRSVTRISHARGNVTLGAIPKDKIKPYFDPHVRLMALPGAPSHIVVHQRLRQAQEIFESSSFNAYGGPEKPELLVITCGAGYLFSQEAISILDLGDRVGLLKIGTTWPLPERMILSILAKASRVLFIEEVDPVLENNVKALYADNNSRLPRIEFLGKKSGHVPDVGELSPGLVIQVLSEIMEAPWGRGNDERSRLAADTLQRFAPQRSLAFCAGCPHRASFWAIKNALALDGRNGILFGDIGCYSLAVLPTGFSQSKTLHAMGSGMGMASGFGVLDRLGSDQPSLAVCGDSTFYHAVIPALINGVHHSSNFLLIVLDNSATAMTGFQPHPGSPVNAAGLPAKPLLIEDICQSLGVKTVIHDPFDVSGTSLILWELLQEKGPRVLILRQQCALVRGKKEGKRFTVSVNPDRCLGEQCGCSRLCTRVFRCPGLRWNASAGKAEIDEAICTGCGVCADICPAGAIQKEKQSS
jgi:indolepyruvate ferredoxin oxidoreductase alpha subunit